MKQIIIKKFYEVISIINKKSNYLRDFYKDPPLGPLLTNRILNRTKFMKQTQRDGRNYKYVLIPEVKILGRKTTKQTQRRGRNICDGWFN
jgi:hypothetical protein